ncbi:MAG: hypothetical protein ABFD13_07720 [Candidatus Cryosericum sp.]|nr:hypothetical protein [bacterium]
MNTTAIWVLDGIIAMGMIGAAIAIVSIGRTLQELSRRVSAAIADLQKQAADLKAETVDLMRSTQMTEHHFDQLADRLSKLTSSTDAIVRVVPDMASRRNGGTLLSMVSTIVRTAAATRFLKSIFLRRKR